MSILGKRLTSSLSPLSNSSTQQPQKKDGKERLQKAATKRRFCHPHTERQPTGQNQCSSGSCLGGWQHGNFGFGRQLKEESNTSNIGDLHFLDEGEGAHLLRYNKFLTDPVERTPYDICHKDQFCIKRVSEISCDEDVHLIPHFKILGAFWHFKHRKVV